MIDIDYLKQLLEIFDESSVNDLRIEKEGTAIKLSKNPKNSEPQHLHYTVPPQAAIPLPSIPQEQVAPQIPVEVSSPVQAGDGESTPPSDSAAGNANYHEIRSPIVGTFYTAPNPESPPFVEVGQEVSEGAVLCIVEAMKLMNEIESDVNGTVVKVLVENAQPVEYDQVLFLIEK